MTEYTLKYCRTLLEELDARVGDDLPAQVSEADIQAEWARRQLRLGLAADQIKSLPSDDTDILYSSVPSGEKIARLAVAIDLSEKRTTRIETLRYGKTEHLRYDLRGGAIVAMPRLANGFGAPIAANWWDGTDADLALRTGIYNGAEIWIDLSMPLTKKNDNGKKWAENWIKNQLPNRQSSEKSKGNCRSAAITAAEADGVELGKTAFNAAWKAVSDDNKDWNMSQAGRKRKST